MSYCFEVRDKTIASVRGIVPFAVYVAFFPAMTAGSIDRPDKFIPQLHSERKFDYELAVDGARQMLWGMFKKLVIADRFTLAIDAAWCVPSQMAGINLLIAAFLFSVQLYADFSGYSDMAIGVGKLLGLKTAKNFSYPFFARNIAEFWRNWHISLTSWLTDYVFMPLHDRLQMLLTFTLVTFGMVILRSNNISHWLEYLHALVFNFFPLSLSPANLQGELWVLASIALLFLEWFSFHYKMEYALCLTTKFNRVYRYIMYVLICVLVSAYLFGADTQEFVYQQF
jgi:D-alanyl-lipoteichoic acid acyltransferase DltB (MBOAT superfamily)